MKKELVKTEKQELAQYDPNGCYGAADDITASDITIGRIAIIQATSELAKQGKVRPGAIVNLLDNKELGFKEEKPLLFIPIKSTKYWIEKDGNTDEFIQRYPATDPNEKSWEELVDGRLVKRMYHHAFFVILPEEVKALDAMPLELAFRSTELASAKKLSALLFKLRMRNEPSWNYMFKLTTSLKQKDKYSWFCTDVTIGDKSTEEARQVCQMWYKQISTAKVKVVEEEVAAASFEQPASPLADDIQF